jgi:hypothetical protein
VIVASSENNIQQLRVFEIDPRLDARWAALVESHPRSSVFHTREWLEALYRTYRYKAIALSTNSDEGPLGNGIVFCEIDSWLTGFRLVSLPFSDHCDVLVRDSSDIYTLLSALRERESTVKYAEIRPRCIDADPGPEWTPYTEYQLHAIDLRPRLQELYARLHKDGIQRKIRRAERERVEVADGRSGLLLDQFYTLMLQTRRRHGVPPQPFSWFRNLVDCFGERLTIRVASADNRPIASILTLRHKNAVVYKYGCSDERFHRLGGMPYLFWQAIQQAKSDRLEEFDLGRSEENNPGLIRFKDHLGAQRKSLKYWRFSREHRGDVPKMDSIFHSPAFRVLLTRLPNRLFQLAGRILYRHAG